MKTSHAAKIQGDFFVEARPSEPDPTHRWTGEGGGPLIGVSIGVGGGQEQFTFQEFYLHAGPPWARGRQKEVLAALKRLVNGYSVSPAKLIMDDDDGSVDMDELVFRPNPVERLEISNSDDDE